MRSRATEARRTRRDISYSVTSVSPWFVIATLLSATLLYAQTSYEAPPFDSIHLNVPEISSARDWYLKNMGGNAGETADRVAFGRWSGDHPLPLQLIFEINKRHLETVEAKWPSAP